MIEKIHRYRTLLILGLVLAAAALVFGDFYGGRQASATGARKVLGVAGKTYDSREFHKLAVAPVMLGRRMMGMGDFSFFQFVFELARDATSEDEQYEKFFIGRIILRNARDEFGIHPGEKEVSDFIRNMRAFAADTPAPQPGTPPPFDEAKYKAFVEKTLGPLGITENDFLDLATDMLALSKLKTILSSGIVADRAAEELKSILSRQTIVAELARFDLNDFDAKIDPTEEEIKAYWEPIKDGFTTEERRRFTYVLVSPVFPPEPERDEPQETIADAAASDEEKAAARKQREDDFQLKQAAHADEKREIQKLTDQQVDEFYNRLSDHLGVQDGLTLEQLVAEYAARNEELANAGENARHSKWELHTTDLFTLAQPPAEINLDIRSSSRGGKVPDVLFAIHPTAEEASRFGSAIPVGDGQWLVARLDAEEKAREMTFAEARAEVRAKLIEERATADMKAAAEDAMTKIKEAVTAGRSFVEAAAEAGAKDPKVITDLTQARRPPPDSREPANLFQTASKVDPGAFADIITDNESAFILRVVRREVTKEPNLDALVTSSLNNANITHQTLIFDTWLNAQVEAAKVDHLYRRK